MAFARQAEAPVHVVHLSSAAALEEVRRAKAAGRPRLGRDLPALPDLTDGPLRRARPGRVRAYVISPPLRAAADRDALWAGLADGSLDLVATDHVPDRSAVEKAEAARGVAFDKISNGAPGIETLLAIVYCEGVAKGRITVERMVDLIATTPARRFGLAAQGRHRGRQATPTSSCSTPPRSGRSAPTDLHHTSDYTPYEGMEVAGRRPVGVRPRRRGRPRRRLRRSARRSGGSSSEGRSEPRHGGFRRASHRCPAGSSRAR